MEDFRNKGYGNILQIKSRTNILFQKLNDHYILTVNVSLMLVSVNGLI